MSVGSEARDGSGCGPLQEYEAPEGYDQQGNHRADLRDDVHVSSTEQLDHAREDVRAHHESNRRYHGSLPM